MEKKEKDYYEQNKAQMIKNLENHHGQAILILAEDGLGLVIYANNKNRNISEYIKNKSSKLMHNLMAFDKDMDLDGVKFE